MSLHESESPQNVLQKSVSLQNDRRGTLIPLREGYVGNV